LSKNTTLKILNLGYNEITDVGVIALALKVQNANLRKLTLENIKFSDVWIKRLFRNITLKELYLIST
jgi:Leucine-rich repeat (LRR) protein